MERYFNGAAPTPTQKELDELRQEREKIIQQLSFQDKRRLIAINNRIERILSEVR